MRSNDIADHGVAILAVWDGLTSSWREYHVKGPADFDRFVDVVDDEWTWHAGNFT